MTAIMLLSNQLSEQLQKHKITKSYLYSSNVQLKVKPTNDVIIN